MRSFALLVATVAAAPCTSDHCPDAEAAAMIQMKVRASNPARDRDFFDFLADPTAAARRFVDAPLQKQLDLVRKLRELPDDLKAQLLEAAQAPEHSDELLEMTQFSNLASLDEAVAKKGKRADTQEPDEDSADTQESSIVQASCNTLQCTASTHVDKPDKANILCASSSCTTSTDESTCCDLKASCDTLQCTASTHVDKPNKADILCAGSFCTTSIDESTCCALKFTHVGTGVANAGGEKWLGKALGVDACYDAVMADTQCAKDYMSYVARGDENCGCNKAQGSKTRMSGITDVYKIAEIP